MPGENSGHKKSTCPHLPVFTAGFGTMHANESCWLPGFIGPVPPPLSISIINLKMNNKKTSPMKRRS
jgi:hypothetical protein